MAETQIISWDEIDVDETLSDADQKASDDISRKDPVGRFLCTVVESNAVEKHFNAYSCIAAHLKFRIDDVLEIERFVFDENDQPVKRNNEIVMKKQPVEGKVKEEVNDLYAGRFIYDDVNLHNPKEKDAMKNRRLFIAKKTGIITSRSAKLTTKMWGLDIIGKQVVITTEWNRWKDKDTDEVKKNVRVAWDGYEYAEMAAAPEEDDFSDI